MIGKKDYILTPYTGSYLSISGKENTYNFQVYKLEGYSFETNLKFSKNEQPGVYIFTKRKILIPKASLITSNGSTSFKESATHQLLYCGQTKDLNTRFCEHQEKQDLKGADFNCICILCSKTEQDAINIEKDLLSLHKFEFNKILNDWEPDFKESISEKNLESIEKIK